MADLTGDDPFAKRSYTAPIHIFGFLVKQAYRLQFINPTQSGALPQATLNERFRLNR